MNAEININIRHADSCRVEKPFEKKPILDGLDVRNIQAVRHQ